ncbi:MAG: hypothetical protein H6828_05475 [Planctomycetes bacterium]|nr:hypothetical protein [Planctomycetota bacterium]
MRPTVPLALAGLSLASTLPLLTASAAPLVGTPDWEIVGWNDLGMHCMDSDYQVFSILPPYNTVCAHVVDQNGDLVVLPAGVTVTYQAVADPSGSINTTSAGKTDFWSKMSDFFGVSLPVNNGLAGHNMPGAANTPQPMVFDPAFNWFKAEGIPLTPTDDAGHTNNYPMMRLEVRDASNVLLASTDVVLPVSNEMDCRACHSSGAGPEAMPTGGWANLPDYERDYRVNILRLHDQLQAGNPLYASALSAQSFNPAGLEATAITDGHAVLCASCHASNALPGTGVAGVTPLTQAMHAGHANVTDPISHQSMDAITNRASCYRCHPGSETRCLRGAMGSAVAPDGTLAMQCQSCHGGMATVGDSARAGWFEEPACQSCHTGSATNNNGQIRYLSVYEPNGTERVAVNALFATNPNTPAPGIDLYRFSKGHGGLQCEACHGSTHAIYPTSHVNDNLQSLAMQGHIGTVSDCLACHDTNPNTVTGGPHGMHPIGQVWLEGHKDPGEHQLATCRGCHGQDDRGTVLSRAQGDRTIVTSDFGTKHFWEGYTVSCYDCHNGPFSENGNNDAAPVAQNTSASTPASVPVVIPLTATDNGGTPTIRIVKQPTNGTVALAGNQATYYPFSGFAGYDEFTFAASDSKKESNLATATVHVTAGYEVFGEGHPGATGEPVLTVSAPPTIGTGVPVHLGSSATSVQTAFVLSSTRPDYQPTPWGGVFLVKDFGTRVIQIGPQGMNRVMHIPNSPALIGQNIVLQLVVLDPGASNGYAFSKGLRLTLGE